MKVIILGSAHPLRGGLASYNERLAREFIRQRHSVQIYTFSLQYPEFYFPALRNTAMHRHRMIYIYM